ncbi:hypothetical protein ABD71_18660 [Brevibacillus laterosporus]|nr:hypothetical protein [Brevibacillus laterosporus]
MQHERYRTWLIAFLAYSIFFQYKCKCNNKATNKYDSLQQEKTGASEEGTENLTIFRRNYIASSKKTAQIHFLNARVVFFTIFIGLLFCF